MKYFLFLISIITAFSFYSCGSLSINKSVEVDRNEDWLFIGGDLAKTNISKSKIKLDPPFNLYWQYDVDGGIAKNALAVSDAILFTTTLNGEFFAIDVSSGKSLGRTSTIGKSSFSTPVIYGNSVIIASSGDDRSKIFNYNLAAGIVKWNKKIGWLESSPVPDGDNVICCSVNGLVYNINRSTGNMVWTSRTNNKKKVYGSFYTSPTITNNLILAGNSDFNLYAFSLKTGKEVWKYKTGNSINADVSINEDRIYFGSDDKYFYCLDTTGNLIWKKFLNTKFLSSATFYNNTLIISAINGNVYSLNQDNGEIIWTYSTFGTITASPLLHEDKIFIGSYDKYFYCIDASAGKELWKYQCEGRIKTSAVIWKEFIFTASDEKYIYCFSKKLLPEEKFKEKPR